MRQKDKEWWVLNHVRRFELAKCLAGRTEKNETPDFIVHSAAGRIGIEITEAVDRREAAARADARRAAGRVAAGEIIELPDGASVQCSVAGSPTLVHLIGAFRKDSEGNRRVRDGFTGSSDSTKAQHLIVEAASSKSQPLYLDMWPSDLRHRYLLIYLNIGWETYWGSFQEIFREICVPTEGYSGVFVLSANAEWLWRKNTQVQRIERLKKSDCECVGAA